MGGGITVVLSECPNSPPSQSVRLTDRQRIVYQLHTLGTRHKDWHKDRRTKKMHYTEIGVFKKPRMTVKDNKNNTTLWFGVNFANICYERKTTDWADIYIHQQNHLTRANGISAVVYTVDTPEISAVPLANPSSGHGMKYRFCGQAKQISYI